MAVHDFLYHYKAVLSRVIDGDTVVFKEIDMGLDVVVKNKHARLLGINTPELHDKNPEVKFKANEAKEYLESRFTEDVEVIIKIREYKPFDSFGRILADVYIDDELINDTLLELGFAVEFMK
ncbi:thermonuclease family protein [Priestia megaterium]|uniref:thermonuclease family protein n=1 Tax=Priestia megaterium TaxID=1404 RepID=UPI002E1A6B10|nr:thermonuclease family protein [Priestia megaterium]